MLLLFTWDTITVTPRPILYIARSCIAIATYRATCITGQPVRATTNTFPEVK